MLKYFTEVNVQEHSKCRKHSRCAFTHDSADLGNIQGKDCNVLQLNKITHVMFYVKFVISILSYFCIFVV